MKNIIKHRIDDYTTGPNEIDYFHLMFNEPQVATPIPTLLSLYKFTTVVSEDSSYGFSIPWVRYDYEVNILVHPSSEGFILEGSDEYITINGGIETVDIPSNCIVKMLITYVDSFGVMDVMVTINELAEEVEGV